MSKPNALKFRDTDPLQDYYNDGEGGEYSVARLVDETKNLEPFDMPLAGINLSDKIWQGMNMFGLAWHCKRVFDADLSLPIILDWNGCIADGRHRVLKAIIDGKKSIKAVRLTWRLEPCRKVEM